MEVSMMQNVIIAIFFSIVGMCIASFLHTLVFRIEKGSDIRALLFESSNCDRCNKKIPWYALIPFFGYLIIGGKCVNCKAKIPIIYPLSELFLGVSFGAFVYYGVPIGNFFILALLFFISFFDINTKSIPKKIVHFFIICGFLYAIVQIFAYDVFVKSGFTIAKLLSIAASVASIAFMMIINFFKKSFGLGDILIIIGLGFFLNSFSIIILLLITLFVSFIYIIIMVIIKRITLKSYIPLIPFITVAFVLMNLLILDIDFPLSFLANISF